MLTQAQSQTNESVRRPFDLPEPIDERLAASVEALRGKSPRQSEATSSFEGFDNFSNWPALALNVMLKLPVSAEVWSRALVSLRTKFLKDQSRFESAPQGALMRVAERKRRALPMPFFLPSLLNRLASVSRDEEAARSAFSLLDPAERSLEPLIRQAAVLSVRQDALEAVAGRTESTAI